MYSVIRHKLKSLVFSYFSQDLYCKIVRTLAEWEHRDIGNMALTNMNDFIIRVDLKEMYFIWFKRRAFKLL
jgi:hypothetical protein